MLKEFFTGNRQEQRVLKQRDHLASQGNLSSKNQQKLAELDVDANRISRRLFLRKIGAAGLVATVSGGGLVTGVLLRKDANTPAPDQKSTSQPKPQITPEAQSGTNLNLSIDEAGFFRAVAQGTRFGIITETDDKAKMDHLRALGDIWVSEASSSFKLAINQPMADFIFTEADLANPLLPTRIIFDEDWVDADPHTKEQVGGFHAISIDGSEQVIVISLKAAALETFLDLEENGLGLADYFDGAVSYRISKYMAHEAAHAGRQNKRLLKKGETELSGDLYNITHPQIHDFEQRYTVLYNKAVARGSAQSRAALIFGVNLSTNITPEAYKAQIFQEARSRGMIK